MAHLEGVQLKNSPINIFFLSSREHMNDNCVLLFVLFKGVDA